MIKIEKSKTNSSNFFFRLADKLWQDVDPKDFACKPEIRVPQSVVFSQPGANVTLSCFIIGTPMPDAKWVLKVRNVRKYLNVFSGGNPIINLILKNTKSVLNYVTLRYHNLNHN